MSAPAPPPPLPPPAQPRGATSPLPAPDAASLARSQALLERISARIAQSGGWISFAQYMQMALYEPGLGYYDAAGSKFGAAGDFVTAPEISPLFAQSLARCVGAAFATLPAQVLEFGAGTGALAYDLLHALEQRGTPARQYWIVEVSGDLRRRQQQRLAGLPVRWLDRLPEAFEGVIVANEVLDVLPVQLFVRQRGTAAPDGVFERGVVAGDDGLGFAGRPAAAPLAQAVAGIEAALGPLPDGYGSEYCPLAAGWLAAVAACLRRGLVLLFDYGFPRHEYYHAQRAMGTLMCHYRQHAHADPLWRAGPERHHGARRLLCLRAGGARGRAGSAGLHLAGTLPDELRHPRPARGAARSGHHRGRAAPAVRGRDG